MKTIRFITITLFILSALINQGYSQKKITVNKTILVEACGETTPVAGKGDAADDPAVWIHPQDPGRSLIIGTNKKQGIGVYDLSGTLLHNHPVGRINNVDVRYGFPLGDKKVDIVAGSNRTDSSILVMAIRPEDGSLYHVLDRPLKTGLDEVYGFCLYHDPIADNFYAFVNGTDGKVEQWHLQPAPGEKITAARVRVLALQTQTEGCVADDEKGFLYIGEEDRGIWKVSALPGGKERPVLVDSVGSGHLKADIEGLTIYYGKNGKGYLIASSQGENAYAVYEREGNNRYVGSFKIGPGKGPDGKTVDGTSETDGIDVTGCPLGSRYPSGIFVAQDGDNRSKRKKENQNFKIVSWEKIASGFQPSLLNDTICTSRKAE